MVTNAFIFVVDALRRDYLPESVRTRGDAVKTIASSTITPTSFSTICSGVEPPSHGVRTFYYQLDRERNLLNLPDYNTSFWQLIESGGLYDVLDQDPAEKQQLSEIDPPFIHVERELSAHAPYANWDQEYLEKRQQETADNFFEQFHGDWDGLRAAYEDGAEEAGKHFETRLQTLADRDLLDDTLVIFTSDHGELLGEYGEWSHSSPLVPELVDVPTVLIHPDEEKSSTNLFRHVDILPTVADVLDIDVPWEMAGESYYSSECPRTGYAEYWKPPNATATSDTAPIHRRYEYLVRSVWDTDGGWVFNESSLRDRLNHLPITAHRLLWPPDLTNLRRAPSGFRQHFTKVRQFGNPAVSHDEAETIIDRILEKATTEATKSDLSDEQREQLQQLGYL